MIRRRLRRTKLTLRPAREPAQRKDPVIHDKRPRDPDVHAELCRDFDHLIAARLHLRRKRAALRPQDVGSRLGMMEGRQVDRILAQFDADQPAAARQHDIVDRIERIERQVARRIRGIRLLHLARLESRCHGEEEGGPEGMRRAQQVAQVHGLADALDADSEIAAHGAQTCMAPKGEARCFTLFPPATAEST